jgi:hypothetical protein
MRKQNLPRSLNLNENLNYEFENKKEKEKENTKEKKIKPALGPVCLSRSIQSPLRAAQPPFDRAPSHTDTGTHLAVARAHVSQTDADAVARSVSSPNRISRFCRGPNVPSSSRFLRRAPTNHRGDKNPATVLPCSPVPRTSRQYSPHDRRRRHEENREPPQGITDSPSIAP